MQLHAIGARLADQSVVEAQGAGVRIVQSAGLETFDPAKHDVLVWLGCAGSFDADFQKSLRSMFDILRARRVTFGVLSKERCNGDPAKRTGNEYMYQELATANIEDLKAAGPKKPSFDISRS